MGEESLRILHYYPGSYFSSPSDQWSPCFDEPWVVSDLAKEFWWGGALGSYGTRVCSPLHPSSCEWMLCRLTINTRDYACPFFEAIKDRLHLGGSSTSCQIQVKRIQILLTVILKDKAILKANVVAVSFHCKFIPKSSLTDS
ncbi:hypothetical protein U1Q18_007643 [Sarracenia purpurea var. burkii]